MGILVTGGTGFIGAQVVRLLLQKGEKDISVFDINASTKLLDDIADKIEIVRGDLGNFSHILNVVEKVRPTTIYHLGGMLSLPSDADHAASFRANAMGTFHVLEAARLFKVPKVLFSSTQATYGLDIRENIKMVNYIIAGPNPPASAQELAEMVRRRLPDARISFETDWEKQKLIDGFNLPIDDRFARREWNWRPEYDQEQMVDDFLAELRIHPQRYI